MSIVTFIGDGRRLVLSLPVVNQKCSGEVAHSEKRSECLHLCVLPLGISGLH